MVPLEQVLRRRAPERELATVEWDRPRRRAASAPLPAKEPRRFRVIDVRSRRVLGDRLDGRATLAVLRAVRSVVDVHVHVWQPDSGRWRLLSTAEQQSLWRLRDREPVTPGSIATVEPRSQGSA